MLSIRLSYPLTTDPCYISDWSIHAQTGPCFYSIGLSIQTTDPCFISDWSIHSQTGSCSHPIGLSIHNRSVLYIRLADQITNGSVIYISDWSIPFTSGSVLSSDWRIPNTQRNHGYTKMQVPRRRQRYNARAAAFCLVSTKTSLKIHDNHAKAQEAYTHTHNVYHVRQVRNKKPKNEQIKK